ncbi:MAG: signal peptidase I, partial [Dehalococcoidia bacterium]
MASTTRRNRTERLFRQGWQFLWPQSSSLPPSPWLRLRGLSWRRLLKRLPLYAGLVMAAGALALVLAASAPRLFGYHTFVIYGGSMAPALRPGDVALTKPVAAEDIEVGDIIATRPNSQTTPVLHRVTAIEEEDGQRQFVIKGDRNEAADPKPVLLLGSGDRVVHRVPFAGYLIHFVRTLPGRLLFLVVPTVLLGGIILWEIWRPRRAAEVPAPLSASEGPEPEAGPVAVPAPTLEVVVPD